jgi:hypothetical protein
MMDRDSSVGITTGLQAGRRGLALQSTNDRTKFYTPITEQYYLMKTTGFSNVARCSLIRRQDRFGETFCIHIQAINYKRTGNLHDAWKKHRQSSDMLSMNTQKNYTHVGFFVAHPVKKTLLKITQILNA